MFEFTEKNLSLSPYFLSKKSKDFFFYNETWISNLIQADIPKLVRRLP